MILFQKSTSTHIQIFFLDPTLLPVRCNCGSFSCKCWPTLRKTTMETSLPGVRRLPSPARDNFISSTQMQLPSDGGKRKASQIWTMINSADLLGKSWNILIWHYEHKHSEKIAMRILKCIFWAYGFISRIFGIQWFQWLKLSSRNALASIFLRKRPLFERHRICSTL